LRFNQTRVSLVVCALLFVTPLSAQIVQEAFPADGAPPPDAVIEEAPPLPVFRTNSVRPPLEVAPLSVTTNLVSGDAGELLLASPPVYNGGLFLNAKTTAFPSISARLGATDNTAVFHVLTPANAPLLGVRGDGRVWIGVGSPTSKFTVFNATAGFNSITTSSITTYDTPGTAQSETNMFLLARHNVPEGLTNAGGLMGGRMQAYHSGAGRLENSYGLWLDTGLMGAATGTLGRATGLRINIDEGGGTLESAYALWIEDVPGANYAIYQPGADDKVYFGGQTGFGALPSASYKLEVTGVANVYGAARRVVRFFDSSAMTTGVGAGMDFLGKYTAAGAYTQFANIKGVKATATEAEFDGHLVLSVNDDGQMFEAVRIARNQMTVTGSAHFTGTVTGTNISATYQDVAEWVPTTQDLAPGTVVVLDATASNHVVASTRPYDTTVAGVVSPQPGLILGIAGPEKAMIATTGRVKVRVDASAGPIAIGDLLVTGTKPGLAMKSQPVEFGGVAMHRPGTVVGKALEPLAGGEGEILVLLSLQ
jgi:hypothetical protein